MQSSVLVLISTLLATTMASPHGHMWSKKDLTDIETKCGITGDAVLSDCENLLNNDETWTAEWHGDEDNVATCTFTNPLDNKYAYPAFNPACSGECCIYATERTGGTRDISGVQMPSEDRVREMAKAALGCAAPDVGKVNGQARDFQYRICLSNREGCGDCFDDFGES